MLMRFRTMGSVKVFKPCRLVWRGLEPYPKTNTGTPREQPGKPPGTPREPPGTPREPPVTHGEFRNICRLAVMKLFSSQNIQIYSGKGFAACARWKQILLYGELRSIHKQTAQTLYMYKERFLCELVTACAGARRWGGFK